MRQLNGTALAFDIAAPEAPAQIAAALDEQGVDIVVHNAGITKDKTIAKMTEAAWQSVIDINLSAQERIDDALLAAGILRDGGRIIGVSSISGIAGNLGQTNYADLESRRDRPRAKHGAASARARHHDQCGRAGLHRNADDREDSARPSAKPAAA